MTPWFTCYHIWIETIGRQSWGTGNDEGMKPVQASLWRCFQHVLIFSTRMSLLDTLCHVKSPPFALIGSNRIVRNFSLCPFIKWGYKGFSKMHQHRKSIKALSKLHLLSFSMNTKKRHWSNPHTGTPPGHEEPKKNTGRSRWEGRPLATVAPNARCSGSGPASWWLTHTLAQGPRCRSGVSIITVLKVLIILSLNLYFISKVWWHNEVGVWVEEGWTVCMFAAYYPMCTEPFSAPRAQSSGGYKMCVCQRDSKPVQASDGMSVQASDGMSTTE